MPIQFLIHRNVFAWAELLHQLLHYNLNVDPTIVLSFCMAMLVNFFLGNIISPLCSTLLLSLHQLCSIHHKNVVVSVAAFCIAPWHIFFNWIYRFYVFIQDKDLDKAVDAFSRAVQIDPENGEAWNNIACLYAQCFLSCTIRKLMVWLI